MKLQEASDLAEIFAGWLKPFCQRIEVAGSVRRCKPDGIKDIEFVCIANPVRLEFGKPPLAPLYQYLDNLRGQGEIMPRRNKRGNPIAWGMKERAMVWKGIPVDVFITDPERWGVRFLLATGPAEWNHRLVTPALYGGLLPAGWTFRDGRIWNGASVPTPEEADVFRVLGLQWLEPWERKA